MTIENESIKPEATAEPEASAVNELVMPFTFLNVDKLSTPEIVKSVTGKGGRIFQHIKLYNLDMLFITTFYPDEEKPTITVVRFKDGGIDLLKELLEA